MSNKVKSLLFFTCFVTCCLFYYDLEKNDEMNAAFAKAEAEKEMKAKKEHQNYTDTHFNDTE